MPENVLKIREIVENIFFCDAAFSWEIRLGVRWERGVFSSCTVAAAKTAAFSGLLPLFYSFLSSRLPLNLQKWSVLVGRVNSAECWFVKFARTSFLIGCWKFNGRNLTPPHGRAKNMESDLYRNRAQIIRDKSLLHDSAAL